MAVALRLLVLACCCLPLLTVGESHRSGMRRGHQVDSSPAVFRIGTSPVVFRIGNLMRIGCALLSEEEADRMEADGDSSELADRIASRRTSSSSPQRPIFHRRPLSRSSCPNGVTYFDGCNSCSCGTEQLCTLKACNADTTVDIYDPCIRITCGYHQKCQAICVGQLCQLQALCVSDDHPTCHNCPWLCVDERLNCSDSISGGFCKPTLACYRR